MLHALIYALNGWPGNVFVQEKNDMIRVATNLPFLHAQEREELESLCQIATFYLRFKNFIKRYDKFNLRPPPAPTSSTSEEVALNPGLYLRSLAYGLNVVLGPYRKLVLALEQELLRDPHLPVAHIKARLGDYFVLFPAFGRILDEVADSKAHGCFILEIVHRNSAHGVPFVQNAVKKLFVHCHAPLYKQLISWMLHGSLFDPFAEFFVEAEPASADAGVVHRIRGDLLPSYMGARVADKILFVGQAVTLFQSEEPTSRRKVRTSKAAEELVAMAETYSRKLIQLRNAAEFRLSDLEAVVDEIRGIVASLLWKLMVQEADLFAKLCVIKDFYLLGRGELFLTFIDQAMPMLTGPPTSKTEHDVNVSLQQSYRQLLIDDDVLTREFRLTIDTKDFPRKATFLTTARQQHQRDASETNGQDSTTGSLAAPPDPPKNGWQQLGLQYMPSWPLHLLFTPKIVQQFDTVFRFLLYVKRVQVEIQQSWMNQMRADQSKKSWFNATLFWQLRNHMGFLIDNLQYYLQVDVIESLFSRLVDKIKATRDFEECRLSLETFVASLLSQCFLQKCVTTQSIQGILQQIEEFIRIAKILNESPAVEAAEEASVKLEEIAKSFSNYFRVLFKSLSRSKSMQPSPHLSQLLLRLDYNGFYSGSEGSMGYL